MNRPRSSVRPHERDEFEDVDVSPLELFFDLVFVFALTQVTAFMSHEIDVGHTLEGVLRGVLILMLLWWAWTGYAWLAMSPTSKNPLSS